MTVDKTTIVQAIAALSSVENIFMDPHFLVDDAIVLSSYFNDGQEYKLAVVNTVKAFKDIAKGVVDDSLLAGRYEGWSSYHYQPRVAQGALASMRIIYKQSDGKIYVLGFGHRSVPSDIYRRLSELRLHDDHDNNQ